MGSFWEGRGLLQTLPSFPAFTAAFRLSALFSLTFAIAYM